MLVRVFILILFGLVAASAASVCVQIHHPFPSTGDELLMKLAALLLFIGVLVGEYLLWRKMGLHLPPPPPRKRTDITPLAHSAPANSEQPAGAPGLYKRLFPIYTLALILTLGVWLLRNADHLYYQSVRYGYFRMADALRVLAGANADNTGILQYCCGWKRDAGETPEQRTAQLRYLLTNGANPNLRQGGTTPLLVCMASESYHLLPVLVEYGADLRATDAPWDISPVFSAVSKNNPELLKYLLQHGAEPDKPQAMFANMTPLHRAVEFAPDMDEDVSPRLECIRLLLEAGADVNSLCQFANRPPRTPLDTAENKCGFAEAIPLLREHGARHAHELPAPAAHE